MKTVLSKINLTAFALFMLVLPAITSCNKDDKDDNPTPQTGLSDKWEVSSFTIEGVEIKGVVIRSSQFEFDATTNTTGTFSWVMNYTDNTSDTVIGTYTLTDEGNKITLDSNGDKTIELDITVAGDKLELSGVMDESLIVVKADRK